MESKRNMAGTALLALAAAFGVAAVRAPSTLAANVQPAAAMDYVFTAPMATNRIRGIFIGGGKSAVHHVPRGEDWDWLAEAEAERTAISLGRWPRSNDVFRALKPSFGPDAEATNAWGRVAGVRRDGTNLVTNIVATADFATNNVPFSRATIWPESGLLSGDWNFEQGLDATPDLIGGPTFLPYGGHAVFTDDVKRVVLRGFDNRATNVFTVAFSNGAHVVALTNFSRWTTYAPAEEPYKNVWTADFNSFPAEFFLEAGRVYGGTNTYYGLPPEPPLWPVTTKTVLDGIAKRLRRPMRVLWDRRHDGLLPYTPPTNIVLYTVGHTMEGSEHFEDRGWQAAETNYTYAPWVRAEERLGKGQWRWPVYDDDGHRLYTNENGRVEAEHKITERIPDPYMPGATIPDPDKWFPQWDIEDYVDRYGTGHTTVEYTNSFDVCDWPLVETNGVKRIEPEALFASVECEYGYNPTNFLHRDSRPGDWTNFTAVVPLALPEFGKTTNEVERAEIVIGIDPQALAHQAFAAAGQPPPPLLPGDDPKDGYAEWNAHLSGFYFFVRGHPVTVPPEDETEEQQKE